MKLIYKYYVLVIYYTMSSKWNHIYSKNVLCKDVTLNINLIGSNINSVLRETLSNKYEGKCIKEGYIKKGSIEIINYSAGVLKGSSAVFNVSFECLICKPVEGMKIKCKVINVTMAGIRAVYSQSMESPLIVFIARDHYYNEPIFTKIKEDDLITIKVIGTRYELNDKNIYIIAELLRLSKSKKQKK